MNSKSKKQCKGRGLSRGFGCGNVEFLHPLQKGLCANCWRSWLLNSTSGKEYLNKTSLKVNKEIKSKQAKQKTKGLRDLMSADAYRSKVLQPVINEIARLIDFGQPCIASRKFGKMAGGHRKSVGSNRGIALNLHNIHIQSFQSNSWNGGDERAYDKGIIEEYGQEYLDYLISIENHSAKFNKMELEEAFEKAKAFRVNLRKNKCVLKPEQRIAMRSEANAFIGLYDSIEPFYYK